MNWKTSLTVFASLFLVSFPYNIIGCGGEIDPYDYHVSFFQNNLSNSQGYRQFYYTGYNFLYDRDETLDVSRVTSDEWIGYCGKKVGSNSAYDFVCKFSVDQLSSLYSHLEKNRPLQLPDSVMKNGMTTYFLESKDLEALGYLMYAKQVERHATGDWTAWEPIQRDSVRMAKLIQNGFQLHAAAKKDFIKCRYAYQILRLAHYSHRYKDVLDWYEKLLKNLNMTDAMRDLCLGLKAGAMMRTGQQNQAAYLFSTLFAQTEMKRVSNYMSFSWCVNGTDVATRQVCMAYCKTPEEKANLLGLFALGSVEDETKTIKQIYRFAPNATMLEVLAIREVNKIEEKFLTPTLSKLKGGVNYYDYYLEESTKKTVDAWRRDADSLIYFCSTAGSNALVKNPGLYQTIGSYLSCITRQYSKSHQFLEAARKQNLSSKLADQCQLTEILLTINEKDKIDATFEQQLLPPLKWLDRKAKSDKGSKHGYWEENKWANFKSNLMRQVLAKRYHSQGDIYKEALCLGASGKDFVRDRMETKDILELNMLLQSKLKTPYEQWLCGGFEMTNDEVIDMIAMTHIRDYNFAEAVNWLQKIKDPQVLRLQRNPFAALMTDNQENAFDADNGKFDKLSFVKQMAVLGEKEKAGKASAADLYKYASGNYNMTYYGRAWEMVKYFRSGSDGYYVPKGATSFEREYYGVFRAEQIYQEAMKASTDANFRAKCLFMMAKCSQKHLQQPQYEDYYQANSNSDYKKYELDTDQYESQFMNNKYFPQLMKEYGNTAFYKEAWSSCSYLRDFLKKKAVK